MRFTYAEIHANQDVIEVALRVTMAVKGAAGKQAADRLVVVRVVKVKLGEARQHSLLRRLALLSSKRMAPVVSILPLVRLEVGKERPQEAPRPKRPQNAVSSC